ncbi:hypothetical protein FRB99_009040 [Tulasnella sp. 403]|nr:hypothetical protein FRB99_009040 [Tulasnella sp. 403]
MWPSRVERDHDFLNVSLTPTELVGRTLEILCNDEYYKSRNALAMIGTCVMMAHLISTDTLGTALMEKAKIHLHLFKRCWSFIAEHRIVPVLVTDQILVVMIKSAYVYHVTSKTVSGNKATVILDLMKEQHLIMLLGRVLLAESDLYEASSYLLLLFASSTSVDTHNQKDSDLYEELSKIIVQVCKEKPGIRNEIIKPPWRHILSCIQDLIYDGSRQNALDGNNTFQDALSASPKWRELQVWRDFGKELGLDENAPATYCVDEPVYRL